MIQTKTVSSMTSAHAFDRKMNDTLKRIQDDGNKIIDIKHSSSPWFYYIGMIIYEEQG
ncbi:hypothetical protein OZX65_07165 [Leuconostocaceae bacterium ESL0723]|nr:hypothetical protein OZX65_07165 [Leuconostocaceae bacterium ESL0723]